MRSFCPWGQTFLHSGPPRPTTTSRSRELGKRAKRRISRSHILELRIRNQKASKKILNQLVSYFGIGNQKASKKKNFKPASLYFGTRNQELEKRAKTKISNQQVPYFTVFSFPRFVGQNLKILSPRKYILRKGGYSKYVSIFEPLDLDILIYLNTKSGRFMKHQQRVQRSSKVNSKQHLNVSESPKSRR